MRWLSDHWDDLSHDRAPDVVVTGGWPFFNIAKVCAPRSVPSLFIDAGAVPHDGMPADLAAGQRELRRVRARALPGFTAVLPISDFIRDSQTLPERGSGEGVHTVLLGADHLESPMFSAPAGDAADAAALAQVKRLAAEGYRLVAMLGRFESEGYKNSPAVFDVFARILEREPDARLLLLARPDDVRAARRPASRSCPTRLCQRCHARRDDAALCTRPEHVAMGGFQPAAGGDAMVRPPSSRVQPRRPSGSDRRPMASLRQRGRDGRQGGPPVGAWAAAAHPGREPVRTVPRPSPLAGRHRTLCADHRRPRANAAADRNSGPRRPVACCWWIAPTRPSIPQTLA